MNYLPELIGHHITLRPLMSSDEADIIKAASDGELWNLNFTVIPSAKTAKASSLKQEDSTEGSGGFIIFIIGLLCGLTVVLSSLAIYNFLSRETAPASKAGHEASAAGAGHDAPAHGEPAHDSPAKEDTGHGSTSSHDKPASDSSSKAKSH